MGEHFMPRIGFSLSSPPTARLENAYGNHESFDKGCC
jgi:hypothetical protein